MKKPVEPKLNIEGLEFTVRNSATMKFYKRFVFFMDYLNDDIDHAMGRLKNEILAIMEKAKEDAECQK